MTDIPPEVRNAARVAGVEDWLDDVPAIVESLAHDWSLTTGAVMRGGTEAIVVEATRTDGSPAVIKLYSPARADAMASEATVLRLVAGDGCVRLLDDDVPRRAMLLERLGPMMSELGLPRGERHRQLCDAARQLWRPAADTGLMTGVEKARWLVEHIERWWEELDRPCPRATIDHAVACAARRVAAHDDRRARLVHGDVHQWNALQTLDGSAFKLVDPDGLIAEPEYDLGVTMREDPGEDDLRQRANTLAALTGTDAQAIWEWGQIERVSTALLGTLEGLQPGSRLMLDDANRCAISDRGSDV